MRVRQLAMLVLCVSGCADTQKSAVDLRRDAGSLRADGIELSGAVDHFRWEPGTVQVH
jgi:hypothetical protein